MIAAGSDQLYDYIVDTLRADGYKADRPTGGQIHIPDTSGATNFANAHWLITIRGGDIMVRHFIGYNYDSKPIQFANGYLIEFNVKLADPGSIGALLKYVRENCK